MIIPRLSLHSILAAGIATTALHAASQFDLIPGQGGAGSASHQTVNTTWKQVWADEFTGPNIDKTKWEFEVNGDGGGNGEQQYYTDRPENAKIVNGKLVITGIKENYKGKPYTSARLRSKGKGDWLYGRFEANIKVPEGGKGIWPAFWMMPTDEKYGGWASSGEIDIMEMVGHQANTLYGTLHYGGKWPKNVHTGDKLVLPSGKLGDAFHTYAVEWEPGVIRWYFDGKLYQTQTKWNTSAAPFPAPFDQKFYFVLNFAIGGAWPGPPNADTKFPQTMEVDYVRAYQPAGGFPKAATPAAPAPAAAAPVAPVPETSAVASVSAGVSAQDDSVVPSTQNDNAGPEVSSSVSLQSPIQDTIPAAVSKTW